MGKTVGGDSLTYILFVCGHNAGRSQMSQGFFNHDKAAFPNVDIKYEAISVGTRPSKSINSKVISVMGEVGIDLTDSEVYFPKGMDSDFIRERQGNIGRVIMACDDTCILPPEVKAISEHWNLPDPHGQSIEKVREIRDLTRQKVKDLLEELTHSIFVRIYDIARTYFTKNY